MRVVPLPARVAVPAVTAKLGAPSMFCASAVSVMLAGVALPPVATANTWLLAVSQATRPRALMASRAAMLGSVPSSSCTIGSAHSVTAPAPVV